MPAGKRWPASFDGLTTGIATQREEHEDWRIGLRGFCEWSKIGPQGRGTGAQW